MQFNEFGLKNYLLEAIKDLGFDKPTEVQEFFIPEILKGRSIIGQSQTGSGKTHTFLLPLFSQIDENLDEVQVIITAPSRELAYQIYEASQQLNSFNPNPLRISCFVGGTDKKRQMAKLNNAMPHVVIGTPGRVLDLIKEQSLKVHTAFAFVVDEADMTLDMGFLEEVDQIAGRLPYLKQMLVFSATIPVKLRPFLKKYVSNAVVGEIKPKQILAPTIQNDLLSTKGRDKNQIIYELLTMGNPYLAIVFANTKDRVDSIYKYLRSQGLKVARIHGDISPRERKRLMKQIQNLDYQYVVATDLAARGIDIEGVSLVINDGIPKELEFFVHRVGRTGRNGLEGHAITFYQPGEDHLIKELESMGIPFNHKELKDGELIDTFDRNRREKRKATQKKLDIEMIGMVKKKKKKVKPGYKKKIKNTIAENQRKKRRQELKQQKRKQRKARKEEY